MKRWFAEEVMENAGIIIAIADTDGSISFFNKQAEDESGYSKEEVLGKDWKNIFLLDDERDEQEAIYNESLEQGQFAPVIESHVRTKGGEILLIEWRCSILRNEDGNPKAVMFIGIDITKGERSKEDLKIKNEEYRTILELIPDGVLVTDTEGTVTYCNQAFADQTGYGKECFLNKPIYAAPTVSEKEVAQYSEIFTALATGKKMPLLEVVWKHNDGSDRTSEMHIASVVKGGAFCGIQAVFRDITDRKNEI